MVKADPNPAGVAQRDASPTRREQILAQALKLLATRGADAVTTRQIAAAVGISQPSLYAFFPDKRAIVDEVSARAFGALAARMSEILEEARDAGVLADLARAYIDFGVSQPDAYRVAFMLERPAARSTPASGGPANPGRETFSLYRRAVADHGGRGLSDDEIDLLAQSIWASLHGLVALMIARPNFRWADRQRLIDLHISRLFARPLEATEADEPGLSPPRPSDL